MLGADGQHQCLYRQMTKFHWLPQGVRPRYCIRNYTDVVSSQIKQRGHWADCTVLPTMWDKLPCPADKPNCAKGLYLEIGANIGACLLMMLSKGDVAHAMAFEPNPANLFYLTSSVMANPSVSDKLSLYPVALGSRSGSHAIYTQRGNAGNTVLDKPIQANKQSVGEVQVVTLDDLMMSSTLPPYIHLAKIDAQGYEVKILEGASKLLSSGLVNAWKFELATEWLVGQGTSAAAYLNAFIEHGYDICEESTRGKSGLAPLSDTALRGYACGDPVLKDLVALRTAPGSPLRQHVVDCSG